MDSRRRIALASLVVMRLAAACSADDDSSAPGAQTDVAVHASTETVAEPEETTSAPPPTTPTSPATSPPSTAAVATTGAPIAALTIEKVAEHPGRRLHLPFTDGETAVVLSGYIRPDGLPSATWVRLDGNGQVVAEGPAEGVVERGPTASTIETAGRRFLLAQYNDPAGYEIGCGLREIDPSTLAMGALIPPQGDSPCFGETAPSDVEPGVVWVAAQDAVHRIDTATGTLVRFPIDGIDVDRQTIDSIQVIDGRPFVGIAVYVDGATNQPMTAPDGSPLSPLVARLDPMTGATVSAAIGGSDLRLVDGRLGVVTPQGARVIDPETLLATAVDPSELVEGTGSRSEIWFRDRWDGDSWAVDTYRADPETGARLAEGTLDTGLGLNEVQFDGVWVGTDLLILAVRHTVDPQTGGSTPVTDVYRVRQP